MYFLLLDGLNLGFSHFDKVFIQACPESKIILFMKPEIGQPSQCSFLSKSKLEMCTSSIEICSFICGNIEEFLVQFQKCFEKL